MASMISTFVSSHPTVIVLTFYYLIFFILCMTPVFYALYGTAEFDNSTITNATEPSDNSTLPSSSSSTNDVFNGLLIFWGLIPAAFFLATSCILNGNHLKKPVNLKQGAPSSTNINNQIGSQSRRQETKGSSSPLAAHTSTSYDATCETSH